MTKPYLSKIWGLLLVSLILQNCTADKAGFYKNDQIRSGKRNDFHDLNDEALKDIKANDLKGLRMIFSKDLNDASAATNRTVDLMSNRLNDNNYILFDEYYIINKYKDKDTIENAGDGINKHTLIYPGTASEMYIASFLPKKGDNQYMITLTYCKLSYGWKIDKLDLGPYTINGKTAPELFKLAKEQYDKKYLIDAVNNTALVGTALQPSDMWHYPIEAKVDSFYKKVLTEANKKYKFPFTIYQVHTRPQIIRVYNQTTPEGCFPTIYYLSDINLQDTVAIKIENAQIKKVIGKVLPGIDKDKKRIYYVAFSEIPTGRKIVKHFDMVDKLK